MSADDKEKSLRAIKYRLVLIFVMVPVILIMAILFAWLWNASQAWNLTPDTLSMVYGALIAAFIAVFLLIGYMMHRRMRRTEDDARAAVTSTDTKASR